MRHNLLVVSDEIYEKLIYDGGIHYSLATFPGMAERTFTLNGFSKAYAMDGWRLGYIAGSAVADGPGPEGPNVQRGQRHLVRADGRRRGVSRAAGLRRQMVAEFDRRRRMIHGRCRRMPGSKVHRPEGAFYFFPNVKSFGMTSLEMSTYLLKEAALATVPGSAFGSWGEGYIRLAYSDSYENLSEAMDLLAQALGKIQK